MFSTVFIIIFTFVAFTLFATCMFYTITLEGLKPSSFLAKQSPLQLMLTSIPIECFFIKTQQLHFCSQNNPRA